MSNRYLKGMRIRHPAVPDWGLGLVLEDGDGEKVRAFFTGVGEKVLVLKHAQPIIVTGVDAENAVLDNLKIPTGKAVVQYKSLSASMQQFLQEFPGGFYGDRYGRHERIHKEAIRDEMQSTLSQRELSSLLSRGDYRAVCDLAIRMTGAQANAMIFKSEKISLREGLKSDDVSREFALSLFELLHGESEFRIRFDKFGDALESAGARKWTIATYFPFFMQPEAHMFVKPTVTQNAADICAFDINYRPEVNAKTYHAVLSFSQYLKEGITSLEPRDMIDVQSFMWCIKPGAYDPEDV